MSTLFEATALVVPFENLRMTDVEAVGGKNASLGEMISQLAASGVRVPGGFATTAHAFRQFLKHEGLDARIGFRVGADTFCTRLHDATLDVARAEPDEVDLLFSAPEARNIAAAVYAGQPLAELEAAGALTIEGDRTLAERFVTLFPLPPKIGG